MNDGVVVTGIGLVTPLGQSADEVLDRIARGETAAVDWPAQDGGRPYPAPARIHDFDAERHFPDNKSLRLMNRDAQLAVVAARAAMRDAAVRPDETYHSHEIALYGSTGLAGLPLEELTPLLAHAAGADGGFDLERFGRVALRRTRPVLTFKILANMPLCFVSMFENVRGPNAVYTPWEGQGAQALAAGIRAIRRGAAACTLVGGCDVKTEVLSLLSLRQLGVFDCYRRVEGHRAEGDSPIFAGAKIGTVPGEGAAFLVLEDESRAVARSARIYARIAGFALCSCDRHSPRKQSLARVLETLTPQRIATLVSAADGDESADGEERAAIERAGLGPETIIAPKMHLGNLFAAAAAVQVALAARLASRDSAPVLANCFGFGSEQAAFVLEGV